VLEAAVDGKLDSLELRWKPGASACVVAASAGYPGEYKTGDAISGLEETAKDVAVFHAGTTLKRGKLVTSGGRVLAVSATGDDLQTALGKAYAALEKIHFDGMYFRRDIGHRALSKNS